MNPEENLNNPEVSEGQETSETGSSSRNRSYSLASTVKRGVNMVAGIEEHTETVSPRGLNEAAVQRLNTVMQELSTLEGDQEIIKGKLKGKTEEVEGKLKELRDILSEYTLIVKASVPQKRWVDFGIEAKR